MEGGGQGQGNEGCIGLGDRVRVVCVEIRWGMVGGEEIWGFGDLGVWGFSCFLWGAQRDE